MQTNYSLLFPGDNDYLDFTGYEYRLNQEFACLDLNCICGSEMLNLLTLEIDI